MPGRFEVHSAREIIARIFGVDAGDIEYAPNYNIAPSQDILIVLHDGTRRLVKSRWGFIPSWSKDPATGYKMINARAESLAEKQSFKAAFEKQRCLVIADGFYEWKKEGAIKKPYYFRLKSGMPFGFAGLFNVWTSPEGERITTSTIITTDANELVRPIHDRMPAIVPVDQYTRWLDPSLHESKILSQVLKPYPSEEMECYSVTPKMNSVKYNDPENIKPASREPEAK
jgi:putative SOS response-associated peptidase YedK